MSLNTSLLNLHHCLNAKYEFLILSVRSEVVFYSQEYCIKTGFTIANESHTFKGLSYPLKTNWLTAFRCALYYKGRDKHCKYSHQSVFTFDMDAEMVLLGTHNKCFG